VQVNGAFVSGALILGGFIPGINAQWDKFPWDHTPEMNRYIHVYTVGSMPLEINALGINAL